MRKQKVKVVPNDSPDPMGWMLTFSDLITLMLTFFVLLLTMSSMDEKDVRAVSNAGSDLVYAAIGADDPTPTNPQFIDSIQLLHQVSRNMSTVRDTTKAVDADADAEKAEITLGELVERVRKDPHDLDETWVSLVDIAHELDMEEKIVFTADKDGMHVRLPEPLTFGPGEVHVRPEADPILKKFAVFADIYDLSVTVAGHTDNRPPEGDGFEDNWALSAARTSSVLQRMIELAPEGAYRYAGVARGDGHPVASNDTAQGRQENRRVEITLKPSKSSGLRESRPGDIDPDPLRPADPRLLIDATVPTGEMGSLGITVTPDDAASAKVTAEDAASDAEDTSEAVAPT